MPRLIYSLKKQIVTSNNKLKRLQFKVKKEKTRKIFDVIRNISSKTTTEIGSDREKSRVNTKLTTSLFVCNTYHITRNLV